MTSNGIPPPRDNDVVYILVRHQEVREKANTETREKAEVSRTRFYFSKLSVVLCPFRFDRVTVGFTKSCLKMPNMESILYKSGEKRRRVCGATSIRGLCGRP